jgi:hypothetical protein
MNSYAWGVDACRKELDALNTARHFPGKCPKSAVNCYNSYMTFRAGQRMALRGYR